MTIHRSAACVASTSLATGIALLLAGCGAMRDIDLEDSRAPSVSVRATWRPAALERNSTSQGGLEIGYERYRAAGTQALHSGEYVGLEGGGPPFLDGPDSLRSRATVQQTSIAYTHRFSFGSNFQFEPVFGLLQSRVRAEVESEATSRRASLGQNQASVLFGVTPRWRFNDLAALELRLVGTANYALPASGTADLGLVLTPVPAVGVRIGYAKRTVVVWRREGSNLNVMSYGPSATLLFDF